MENRLGQRIGIEPLEVGWRAPARGGPLSRLLRRRHTPALLLDLSVTGLLVDAPADERLRVGSIVGFQIDGVEGLVRVRRIEAPPDTSTWRYGVELTVTRSELNAYIHEMLSLVASASSTEWHGQAGSRSGRR